MQSGDPLAPPATWPATTLAYGLSRAAGAVTLTVAVAPDPGLAVPGPGAPPDAARAAAATQRDRLAAAHGQLAQTGVSAWIVTTLRQTASGAPDPVAVTEGTGPLRDYLAASHLYASAAAGLEAVQPTAGATLQATLDEHGLTPAGVARANAGVAAGGILEPGQPLAASAHRTFADGDTAGTILAAVPTGWPQPADAAALLELNASLALREGVAVSIPAATVTVADPATATLAALADGHHTSVAQLAADNRAAAVLRHDRELEWGGQSVRTGPGADSLDTVSVAFAALGVDVAAAELAGGYSRVAGLLADGAEIELKHAVARAGDTLAGLAGTRIAAVAALNTETPNLFAAGAAVALGPWSPAPTVPAPAETLAALAERLGTTPELLLESNTGLRVEPGLVLPGMAALPSGDTRVPYSVRSADTLSSLAAAFATTAEALAEANRGAAGALAGGGEITVTVDGESHGIQTGAGMSLDEALAALQAQSAAIALADLVAAIAATAGALRAGAVLAVPAPALGAAALTPAAAAGEFGVETVAFAAANAALAGTLEPGVTLKGGPGDRPPATVTAASDTINAVLARLAEAGARIGVADLVGLNPSATLFRAGARVLLPPRPAAVSAPLGPVSGPFAAPAFPLTAALRLQRGAGDGAGERAESPVPAPAGDAFVDQCLAVLPDIRLARATAGAGGRAADLWAVHFGAGGIESVAIATRPPRFFALRPLYEDLWNATVPAHSIDAAGNLVAGSARSFQGVDVETWARRFLADLDAFLTTPHAAGVLPARRALAGGIAAGLAPVLALTDAHAEAARASAVADLERTCAAGLAHGYDLAAAIQYDATAASAYTGPARLSGVAAGDPERGYTLGGGAVALDAKSSFVSFELRLPDPVPRLSAAVDVDHVFDTLEIDGGETSTSLSFVRPLDGTYRPAKIARFESRATVPIPVRVQPPTPALIGQSGRATFGGDGLPALEHAAEWTYGVTYAHEHAARDELHLAVGFAATDAADAPLRAASPPDALAAALADYVSVADRLRELMGLDAVRENAAASFATLATAVATAWGAHWARPAPAGEEDPAPAPTESVYGLRLRAIHRTADGLTLLDSLSAVLDDGTGTPGPAGEWPQAFCRKPGGDWVELTAGTPDGGRLVYRAPEDVPADRWLEIRLEWPRLDVATVDGGRAALSATRNADLVPGVETNAALVLETATVEAPAQAATLLEWSGEWELSGSTLGAALDGALAKLFGTAAGLTLTVAADYGREVGDAKVITWLPIARLPDLPLGDAVGTAVASAVNTWLQDSVPADQGGLLGFTLTLQSPQRRLLTLERLVYRLAPR